VPVDDVVEQTVQQVADTVLRQSGWRPSGPTFRDVEPSSLRMVISACGVTNAEISLVASSPDS
jgi:hypothetical protein